MTERPASVRTNWLVQGLTALALVLVRLNAQTPTPQQVPVFRSGIDVVPITVTVTDQRGMPVTDLTQKDFKVIEDGKPREIVGFYPQTLVAGAAPPPRIDVGRRDDRLEPVTRRTFLIVPAFGRIQEPTKALDGAFAFVGRLLPQDAVATMEFHRVTPFTTDHEAVAQLLMRYKKEHERIWWDVVSHWARTRVPYAADMKRVRLPIDGDLNLPPSGNPPVPASMLAEFDRLLFEGLVPTSSLRNSADLLLGMDLAPPTGDRSYKRQYVFADLLYELQRLGFSLSDALLQSSPLKLFAGIEFLRFMDGEKHLVYMGCRISRNADVARLFASRASDARVIVDFVSTCGTRGFAMRSPDQDLAELTGGYYTSLEVMDKALAKVDQRSRSSYLIGYVPVNPAMDGKYRHVTVEVSRPNLTANYRHGYFASEDTPSLEMKELVAAARSDTAGNFDEILTDIDLSVQASVEKATAGAAQNARVDVTIDISPIGIGPQDGLHVGQLEVTVYCGDDKQKVTGQAKVQWNLRANDETFADWLRNGLQRSLRVPVTAKPKFVKVIVYDPVSDRTGSMTTTIR